MNVTLNGWGIQLQTPEQDREDSLSRNTFGDGLDLFASSGNVIALNLVDADNNSNSIFVDTNGGFNQINNNVVSYTKPAQGIGISGDNNSITENFVMGAPTIGILAFSSTKGNRFVGN